MKIYYNDLISATDAQGRMENARPNQDRTIWVERKKGELYLNLSGFRMGTTFKMMFTEEYILLKYSGFFSLFNILLSIFWCGGFCVGVLAWLVLSLLTKSWSLGEFQTVLVLGIPSVGFLWSFIIKHRIWARQYVSKILGLNAKK